MSVRCALTRSDEPECDRPAVVRISDRYGGSGVGCHAHAVRALRGIAGARVAPLPGQDGAAIAVYDAATRRR